MRKVMIWVGLTAAVTLASCGDGGGRGVEQANSAPVASAGAGQTVPTKGLVTLSGAGTDANGDAITFVWQLTTKPVSSQAALSNASVANPTFTADVDGVYVASLIVSDGRISSMPSTVTITASNVAPTAAAGLAQNVVTGSLVTLNGSSSSDTNGDALTYSWRLVNKPIGSAAALTNATAAAPTFTADLTGIYDVALVVSDGKVASASSTVTIVATAANAVPVANAGATQSVVVGTTVTLDGTASSDANGDLLSYAWVLSPPPDSAAVLSSRTAAKPVFTADVAGNYVASLTTNDGKASSAAAIVTVTASVANAPPVARAGSAQTLVTGGVVTLDGTTSSDANGDPLTYAWSLTSKPAGSSAALAEATSSRPTFTADATGTYVASLVVSDGRVNSAVSSVTVTANGVAFDSLVGFRDGIASGKTFTTDPSDMTISTNGSTLTIKLEQFFEGTCIYTATLNATRDGVGAGTFNCSDFTSGTWQLIDMQKVDQADVYVVLSKEGTLKRAYGISSTSVSSSRTLPAAIATLVGSYDGIATGGPFGTEPASSITVSVSGRTLTLTVARFFSGTCQYTATIQEDGRSVSAATYQCSDFTTGSWSLLDLRAVGGNDMYLVVNADGNIRRAYGLGK